MGRLMDFAAGAFCVGLAALALTMAATASPPRGLSASGRMTWNLEGLLALTFGHHLYGVKGIWFVGIAECPSAADCQTYEPVFAPHTATAYHLVAFAPSGTFGNYPGPVRIDGKYVACNSAGTRFLIEFQDTINFELGCDKPQR